MHIFSKKLIYLLLCSIFSIGIVIILFEISQQANKRNIAFKRLFPPHFLSRVKQLELSYNSFYLAGFTKTHIFLGNRTGTSFLLTTNYDLTDTGHLILHIPQEIPVVGRAISVHIDSPLVFMMEGITPRIFCGKARPLTLSKIRRLKYRELYPAERLLFPHHR